MSILKTSCQHSSGEERTDTQLSAIQGSDVVLEKRRVMRWLVRELKKQGFMIWPDYLIEVAGITHKIDVLAVLSPITGVELKIAFIIADTPLRPEDVERFSVWRQEGKFDKVVIIALRDVSVEAYELAKKLGIDIVRVGRDIEVKYREELGKYDVLHVHPIISEESAIKALKKHEKGFLKRIGVLKHHFLIYLPFIEFELETIVRGPEEEGSGEVEELSLTFEGIRGSLVIEEGDTLKPLKDRGGFAELSDAALDMIRILTRDGYKTISELAMELKLGEGKIKSVANFLLNKALVDVYSDVVEIRKTIAENSFSILKSLEARGAHLHEGEPPASDKELVIFPRTSIDGLISFIESFARKISAIHVVYYPFYVGLIECNGEKKVIKYALVDAVTGADARAVSWLLTRVEDVIEGFIEGCLSKSEGEGQ